MLRNEALSKVWSATVNENGYQNGYPVAYNSIVKASLQALLISPLTTVRSIRSLTRNYQAFEPLFRGKIDTRPVQLSRSGKTWPATRLTARNTAALPKTRSGKIMRGLLRDIAAGKTPTGDTTTLEDFSVL